MFDFDLCEWRYFIYLPSVNTIQRSEHIRQQCEKRTRVHAETQTQPLLCWEHLSLYGREGLNPIESISLENSTFCVQSECVHRLCVCVWATWSRGTSSLSVCNPQLKKNWIVWILYGKCSQSQYQLLSLLCIGVRGITISETSGKHTHNTHTHQMPHEMIKYFRVFCKMLTVQPS